MGDVIRIVSNGNSAHVYLNGEDIAGDLVRYSIWQEAGDKCEVEFTYRYYPDEVEFEREDAE